MLTGKKMRGLSILLAAWIVVSLACNFPGYSPDATPLSGEALRQTLAALGGYDTPAPTGSAQVYPGETPAPLAGLQTATPPGLPTALPGPILGDPTRIRYFAQPGDTLVSLAGRFKVASELILSSQPIPAAAFIPPGQELRIPNLLGETPYPSAVLPDSAVVNSPVAAGFDLPGFIHQADGYLSTYTERLGGKTLTAAEVVQLVSIESSVNPKLLLALVEFQTGWVAGQPANAMDTRYPVGFHVTGWSGLYKELVIAATHLNIGYYGWRAGTYTELRYRSQGSDRLSPGLNAGSVAVQSLFARLYDRPDYAAAIYGPQGFANTYAQMFGDPWAVAAQVEPLFPTGAAQPELALPFAAGERWSLTGGPHLSWKTGSPRGAIDWAPTLGERGCVVSRAWVTAPAPGLVTRSDRNVVALDLDGDGFEQTGWVIVFLHVADAERIQAGTPVSLDDRLGHPSCEGGAATGTHVHMARKYNGEWLAADGPLPFILSGWQVFAGEKNYQGELHKGDQVVAASSVGPRSSTVIR
jgi:LasA protease